MGKLFAVALIASAFIATSDKQALAADYVQVGGHGEGVMIRFNNNVGKTEVDVRVYASRQYDNGQITDNIQTFRYQTVIPRLLTHKQFRQQFCAWTRLALSGSGHILRNPDRVTNTVQTRGYGAPKTTQIRCGTNSGGLSSVRPGTISLF